MIPVVIGAVVIAVTGVVVKLIFGGSKKKGPPKTLIEPTVKYPLKLVDKEVSNICTAVFIFGQIRKSFSLDCFELLAG